jgi:acetylornithine deacetylase/succinyl-diaminopimelate desuccinylase-like protein
MDWGKLGDKAVSLLSEYLSIDTTNPPGNELPGAEFLAAILTEEGIDHRIYESEPGRASVLARLKGEGEGKALILLSHIDVVPAEADKWEVHPFSGEVSDGYIWGRGALDMKGMGIMELMAMIAAKREGLDLKRDVVFLAVADEEAGGYLGAKYLLDNYPEEFEADLVINEGGYANTTLVPGHPLFLVSNGEKYGVWIRLLRRGLGGHGSMPTGQGALENLVPALARLLSTARPLHIDPTMAEFFSRLSEHWEILAPYKEDGKVETLEEIITANNLTAIPALNAVVKDTISLNMLHAGVKVNVIPDEAEAFLDCRLLPETDSEEFLAGIREALEDPDLQLDSFRMDEQTDGGPASSSPMQGGYFSLLEEVIGDNYPDAVVSPFIMPGLSDSRFFRGRGVPCYGIIPARVDMEALATIHGVNERIRVEDLKTGVRFIYDLVVAVCTGNE